MPLFKSLRNFFMFSWSSYLWSDMMDAVLLLARTYISAWVLTDVMDVLDDRNAFFIESSKSLDFGVAWVP